MPLIHRENGNTYRPGDSLKRLFKDTVVRPLKARLPVLARRLGNYDVNERVRLDVLDQGRADFNDPYVGPSPLNAGQIFYSAAQKVLLYCALYMPMHLYSSYHVYRTFLSYPLVKVLFVDFGCGPLTSGIAYRAFAEQSQTAYIGIDCADEMLKKAREINQYGLGYAPFFVRYKPLNAHNNLPDMIEEYISDNQEIIFNFCYFLASRSLNARHLANVLVQLVRRYPKHPMRVVYQNPRNERLHQNWRILRRKLLSNGFAVCHNEIETFRYRELITGAMLEKRVACETLYIPPF